MGVKVIMNAYMNQYQNNSILTASPERILIMLYDGAIRFVRQARAAIDAGDRGAKATAIRKAVAIVTEFSNTLDREIGGDVSADLSRLYDFVIGELVSVNVHGDAKRLDPVEKILLELREAFVGAIEINKRQVENQEPLGAPSQQQIAVSY